MILRLSFTYLHTTADAEDICQTVLLRAMTHAPTFSSPEHERAWIIRAAINACKDQLKSAARRTTVALEAAVPGCSGSRCHRLGLGHGMHRLRHWFARKRATLCDSPLWRARAKG
ncbi:MAG: hypothetical protein J6D34_00085, partial [Atopobiaceae bacterium]|nr:hypothetical protein [Atopobiaceae bacterium]